MRMLRAVALLIVFFLGIIPAAVGFVGRFLYCASAVGAALCDELFGFISR